MINIQEELKRVLTETFGPRIKDKKCVFCGSDIEPGKYCQCFKAVRINRYFQKANKKIDNFNDCFNDEEIQAKRIRCMNSTRIPAKYRGMDFEDFLKDTPERKKVYNLVHGYFNECVKAFLTGKNLILTGQFGTGKTLLMSILANRLSYDYGFQVYYINAVDLINEIKDSFNLDVKITTKNILDKYCNADFLFIDDIDKLNATDYVRELMYSVVNTRYENESPIVTSSNNPVEVLDEKFFGEAVVSRLLEKSVEVIFTSKNMRLV